MTILEGLLIGCLAATLLFLLLASYFGFTFFKAQRKLAQIPTEKLPQKKQRKQMFFLGKRYTKMKKRSLSGFFIAVVFAGLLGASGGYIKHYQGLNLSKNDAEEVVKSYYLLRDFEEQIQLASNQTTTIEDSQKNIRYLTTAMASYGTIRASELNTADGQRFLNRYYNAIKELGVNGSANYVQFYEDESLRAEYLQDIEQTKKYEEAVFEFYQVDQAALKES
ncbi:hypothetical protein M2139_000628 [Enterococcus sp. PF1-24]|uniref:hypothetical protein n=1 Tax=unclassified Enterococcus TaxID=2608891 RepID=UPI00247404F6|nr:MULTISPECIES: hypothetical protein [unclassified Enterococcus]MDH6363791.1 hypothetical protein [Enterococcus sp. PFB1-1]MDH6400747.1 hypothetical protein [Enterococcus sp. PF1-24]